MSEPEYDDAYILTNDEIARRIKSFVNGDFTNDPMILTRGAKGLIVSILDKILSRPSYRYAVLGWLFDAKSASMSSKELTDRQWVGLFRWISPFKDADTGEWLIPTNVRAEMLAVLFVTLGRSLVTEERDEDEVVLEDGPEYKDNKAYSVVSDNRKEPIVIFFPENDTPF